MKKIIISLLGAGFGLSLAVWLHCSFMVVSVNEYCMLEELESSSFVVLDIQAKEDDIELGDIVAYKESYYTVGGENGIILRRVGSVLENELLLITDSVGSNDHISQKISISKDKVVGKAILY
jgi:hypothetical protein